MTQINGSRTSAILRSTNVSSGSTVQVFGGELLKVFSTCHQRTSDTSWKLSRKTDNHQLLVEFNYVNSNANVHNQQNHVKR